MLALFGSTSFLRADELTIHDGTANNGYIPMYGGYFDDYTKSEFVFPASELADMNGGTITSMKFYVHSIGSANGWTSTQQVFLKEVASASLDAYSGLEGATIVYEGSLTAPSGVGEMEITFTTPYTYNGGNLLVGVYNITDGTYQFVYFFGENVTGASGAGANSSSLDGVSFNQRNFLPKTTFTYSGGGGGTMPAPEFVPWVMGDPNVPMTTLELLSPEFGAMNVGGSVYLQWITDPNAAEYKIEFGSEYYPGTLIDWTAIDENYPADPSYFDVTEYIVPSTHYFWRISIRNNVSELVSDWYGFTTTLAAPTNVEVTEAQIYTDQSTLVKWKGASTGGGFTGEITVADGTNTSSYIPVYGLWMDDYTLSEMIYPAEMIEEMEGGQITSMSFYISSPCASWAPATFNVFLMEVDNATMTSYYMPSDGQVVYTGAIDGSGTTMDIIFDTPYTYTGGNLLVGFEQLVEGTYHSCSFYGINSTGSSASGYSSSSATAASYTQRDFLPKTTFVCGGKGGNRNIHGFNVYYVNGNDTVKANEELIVEKQYTLTELPYNVDPGLDIHVTAVYDEGESNFDNGHVKVQVTGYGKFEGTVTELNSGEPMENVEVKFYGKDEFENDVQFTTTTNATGAYSVSVAAGTYHRGVASLAGFENALMSAPQEVAYNGVTKVDFQLHEVYNPVYKVYAQELDPSTAKVTWSMYDFVNPTPGGGGGGGSASTFTEGFEGGMPTGWTIINANNDAATWTLTSDIPTTWTYYAGMTLDWYRTGSNAICSGSYINGIGAITPDDYLVTPQVTIANGSTFTFWAAACDAGYPADHFGVFVSDNGTSDWTEVQAWTLTAKEREYNAKGSNTSRDGNGAKIGTWHEFSVDLSNYAGQKYIAIRHFNCNDQYIMCVDDIELSVNSKANRDVAYFNLYRKAILKENDLVAEDSLKLAANLPITDTLYADFDWNNVEPGLYQYGVQAVYPGGDAKGNRDEFTVFDGTATNGYVPVYGFYCDAYLKSEMVYPATEIGEMAGGTISSMKFYAPSSPSVSWGAANFQVFMKEVSDPTISAFAGPEGGTVVYEGALSISGGEMLVEFSTPYTYNGGNLLVGFYNTVKGSYVSCTWVGQNVTGASVQGYSYDALNGVSPSQRNFLPKTTFDYVSGAGSNDNPNTDITWSNVLPKDMTTALTVNAIASTGSVEGATVTLTNLNENANFNGTIDTTGAVIFPEFRKGEYKITVALEGMESDLTETEISVWNETTITAHFTEIFAPVDNLVVSGTGFARWTDMIPAASEVAERYIVNMNDALQGETTNNFMQLNTEGLTVGETYQAKVAVIYTTGMSPWKTANFTFIGCDAVGTQVDSLWYDPIQDESMDITLNWNNGGGTPTPPTPPTPPTGDVIVKLTAPDIWQDGTGYQMLLDDTHSLYGTVIPTTGALSMNCSGNDAIYAQFSHKIPTNADGNCTTSNIVLMNTVEITIPAGTYDWCIVNPTPGDRLWIAAANGNVGGRYDDYVFEGGHIYEFTVSMYGSNDGVDVTVTGGKCLYQPNMGLMSLDNRTSSTFRGGNLGSAGVGFGNANSALTEDGNWYYYDNGINEDAIGTGGGNFWWGIMLPAGSYDGTKLTKVAAYDYMAMTGNVTIYQGGNTAPGTSLGQTNVTFTGIGDFVEFTFADPITVDPTQNLWVIFYNGSGATYPAAVCANTGDANGRWVSTDGSSWMDLASAGLSNTFMVRAYIETGGGGGAGASTYVPGKFNILVDGEVVGATNDNTFTVTATDYDEHLYEVVYVDANYNISCPMGLVIRVPLTSVGSNEIVSSIYPNPTSGDLHIVAADMVRVSVLNTLGQILFDQAVKGDELILNMARYEAGVYMINITTNNGSSVKRVVVTK